MKNIFLNYIEILKNNHFFLLLAIITTFINAIIHIFIFTTFQIIIASEFGHLWIYLLKGILVCLSPFILVWIISFIATLFEQKLKIIVSIITFFINFFVILFQSIIGYFTLIFMLAF